MVTDLSNTRPVDTVVPEEQGGAAEAGEEAAPPQAWEEDRGIIIDEPESEETRKRRYEQEVLRSTQRGWGKQLEAHPHPDLFSQFTVMRQVRHILDNSIHPATSHAAPPRAKSRRSRRSQRGKRAATMKRTGGSASVPALPLARSSRKRQAKKGGVKPKFSPVSGCAHTPPTSPLVPPHVPHHCACAHRTRPASAHHGDVAQTSARTRHFYDMAALKAVIDREGQIRRVKHDVKLIRDALRADASTNVDTLVKGACRNSPGQLHHHHHQPRLQLHRAAGLADATAHDDGRDGGGRDRVARVCRGAAGWRARAKDVVGQSPGSGDCVVAQRPR